jgi:hypothetical protein
MSSSLNLFLLNKQKLKIPEIRTWVISNQSMNILAVNEHLQEIYICDDNKLKVLDYPDNFHYSLKHTLTLEDSNSIESRINHLSLTRYKSEQLLILLTHSGLIFIYFPENWARSPIKLDNYSEDFDDFSVWSCSFHDGLLAVGSNTHIITLWNLDTYEKQVLAELSHNIPCLDFNDKGLLASTCIDTSVNVHLPGGTLTCRPCTEWGWAVKWIRRNAICEAKKVPASNIADLRNRYKSNLPSTYFNGNFNGNVGVSGIFAVDNFLDYERMVSRRINGIPDSDSDFEEDSESMDFDPPSHFSPSKDFENHLLVQTSKNSVHLIDPGLSQCNKNSKMHVLAVYVPNFEVNLGNFSRLSLLHYIETLSLCIVGNQFGCEVIFLKLCKSRNSKSVLGWDYCFVRELTVNLDSRIMALCVNQVGDSARVYALTEMMSFYVFTACDAKVEKLTKFEL